MQITTEFMLTSFIVVASPGTGAIYTVVTGLAQGARTSFFAAAGCTLGIVPHLLAAIFGLAALFHTYPSAFIWLKYAGVCYLLYMAWMSLKDNGLLQTEAGGEARSVTGIMVHAVLINLLNPKLPLFFLAFLPQFITTSSSSPVADMLELSIIFMLMTQLVFMVYGSFAAFMRQKVLTRPKVITWMQRTFCGAFIALSLKLLLSEQ